MNYARGSPKHDFLLKSVNCYYESYKIAITYSNKLTGCFSRPECDIAYEREAAYLAATVMSLWVWEASFWQANEFLSLWSTERFWKKSVWLCGWEHRLALPLRCFIPSTRWFNRNATFELLSDVKTTACSTMCVVRVQVISSMLAYLDQLSRAGVDQTITDMISSTFLSTSEGFKGIWSAFSHNVAMIIEL